MNRIQHLGFLAIVSLCSLPTVAKESAINLQTLWQQFYQQASQLPSEHVVSQTELNRYPKPLLLSSSQYPDFKQFHWQEIQQLWQISQRCKDPHISIATPALQAAAKFELSLCQRTPLASAWFDNQALLHPAGGSYADRYLASLENKLGKDHPETQEFLSHHKRQLTLANAAHPLHSQLRPLSTKGVDALLSGYRAYLYEQNKLWINNELDWKVVKASQWQPLAESMQLKLTDSTATSCSFRYSNLCITAITPEKQWARWALIFSALVIASLLIRSLYQRRQNAKERQFVLQLLTHELRTPITSLGLTVELFREQFDDQNEQTQQAVWRLMADHQRLAQLTETSKGYLTTNSKEQFQRQRAYLSDWLEHCLDKHQLNYALNEDRELELPYYWLGICLDNLAKNAQQHGKGQITIEVKVNKVLHIQVGDQGEFPSSAKRWLGMFSQPKHQANMGIGLIIVSRLMKKMGGKLICLRKPTRCILELPL
ncbi:DUF3404 domain-containing protein [Photobacterium sp. OFAV2-7]|uniref:ATP-binding protein n=1 Tax=Photobacterium sp. OFAV2-7 TaxID=2917748 RepID=UPI001EF5528B|nr:DUF3404 domain-containing protein [Photobacterium sp. OFAV2-7]MCG7585195.1 sensor histidine kinase [Photobacterium sp. OFAV2-7]